MVTRQEDELSDDAVVREDDWTRYAQKSGKRRDKGYVFNHGGFHRF